MNATLWLRPFLAPASCAACDRFLNAVGICAHCEEQLPFLSDQVCEQCALPFPTEAASPHRCAECLSHPPAFEKVTAVFEFAGPVVPLLHAVKFGRNLEALRVLAASGAELFARRVEIFRPDFLCPVPLPFFRRLVRGFNQSYRLAGEWNQSLPRPLPLLRGIRRSWRAPQATQDRVRRLRALQGTMRYLGKPLRGRRILVIDDVVTTGSTAETLSGVLRRAGASCVEVFALARVPREKRKQP
jgi:ComF family protein